MADLVCPICFDAPIRPVSIPCGHFYCKACLDQYVKHGGSKANSSCPTCKATFCTDYHAWSDDGPHACLLPAIRPLYLQASEAPPSRPITFGSRKQPLQFSFTNVFPPSIRAVGQCGLQTGTDPMHHAVRNINNVNKRLEARLRFAHRMLQECSFLLLWRLVSPSCKFLVSWLHWSIRYPLYTVSFCTFWILFCRLAFGALIIVSVGDERSDEDRATSAERRSATHIPLPAPPEALAQLAHADPPADHGGDTFRFTLAPSTQPDPLRFVPVPSAAPTGADGERIRAGLAEDIRAHRVF